MPVFFNGRLLVTPQSASMVDDSGMFNKNLSVGNVTALIGRSTGGKPFTALRFGSAKDAQLAGLVGEELKAVERAFDPSAETTGPSEIVFVRVNPATQASLSLLNSSSAAVITLTSTDYGQKTNNLKVKVEAGSVSGLKLTTQYGNAYNTVDNLLRNALSVTYTGANATATITIADASVTVNTGSTTTIDLTLYPTIQDLVDRLSSIAGVSASVLDGNGAKPALSGLDFATAQNIKSTTYTVTANLQAAVDWFNSTGEGFVDAVRVAAAGTVPAALPFTYLAGGSDGTVTNTEWQKAFDALQTVDVQWICPISSLASIHAMADTHCAFMSGVGKKERRAICGAAAGTTDVAAFALAKALNSDRTSLVHLGFYDYDASGKLVLYPPYVAAAMIAGMFGGVNPGTPLTNKTIKVRGLERDLRNPTDTDQLILAGVLALENTESGYKIVKSITTWLTNTNYNRVEQSVGFACDYTVRSVRQALDGLRGKKGTPASLSEAISRADSTLRELARPESAGGPGILVGDAANPPFKNLTASLDGDVVRVEYQCSPVLPINYILQVAHAVPYSGTASA
jgi:hypothetical protein